ncbi:OX-2 membrane glycoprotein [Hippoglossus stenolepis]|uniref:OX-2 membrane glycoprotein n=1 Tax=Hippoglossus stenolepis TaxID=195615 RepID=UPI001FAFE374|nr:OX-2 membrane glycoprotein [Hippoglossus stenolepis]
MIRALTLVLFALGLFQTGLTSVIQSVETVEEAVGEDALLSCQILQSENVVHVTWQKQTMDGRTNLATFNNIFGSTVISDFRGKVEVIGRGLHNSSIVIKNVTEEEDEGCYLCLFITNPAGALTCRTCLRVYELHEPVLHVRESKTTDEFVVSCSATGRPAPTITLNITQQDFDFSQNNTVSVINTNGTFTVTVTVTVTAVLAGFHDAGTRVGCAVQVLSRRKEAFVEIPDVKLMPTNGLDEGSGSASRLFFGTWIVVVTFLCTASVFTVLLIRKLRSSPSHRDLEKTEVPQTADADTVQVPLFTPEKSPVRKRSPPSESKQSKETDPESSSEARRIQSDHPSHRDLEKTEVPQTADADTVQVALFTPEINSVRKRTASLKLLKNNATDCQTSSKPRRLQFDQ